ncbi:MBL fold metallo-hydrolase [Alkalihalobacterium elongatum]|uniref:MBL fold metallo-hydrolase n=1 Tax=Alkalihalobacterium elongatum TaxID=2675466 RepID=UPI001C1F8F91|nr:MBL fold metallo-hydrolase [Alkalihalobacterium elongatum]
MKLFKTISTHDEVTCLHGTIKKFGRSFTFNVYYVDGLLIDTGPMCVKDAVLEFAKDVQPKQIILTHHHEDHAGNAAALSKLLNIPIKLCKLSADLLQNPPSIPFYRRLIWGKKLTAVHGEIVETSIETENHQFSIVKTPGHSTDHICLVNETNGWLFAGDLFLGKRLLYGMKGESIPQLFTSVNHILDYRFDTIFCGHAGIVGHGHEALEAKKKFLQTLISETTSLYNRGWSEDKITKKLLSRQSAIQLFSGGEMAPKHLIHSIIDSITTSNHIQSIK